MPEIGAATLLKAQNAYIEGTSRKADLPKASMQSDSVNFQKMASQELNKFSKMSPDEILSHVKQTNAKVTQTNISQNQGIVAKNVSALSKTIKNDEETKNKFMLGDASLTEVIEATTEAKTTLQTAIAVRNKVLDAFREIMNMPL